MNEWMFLVDNNVLSHLTIQQRASTFFQDHCRLPTEILHEAQGYPDASILSGIEYPTTARMLGHLTRVMVSIPDDDTTVIDLYRNKGAGDPLLVACALDAMDDTRDLLIFPTWVIVSGDNAVHTLAARHHIPIWTRQQFLEHADGLWASEP